MKPCISQATTLRTPSRRTCRVLSRNGWTAVEIWLTKLEAFLQESFGRRGTSVLADERDQTGRRGVAGGPAALAGGERESTGSTFAHRLRLLPSWRCRA